MSDAAIDLEKLRKRLPPSDQWEAVLLAAGWTKKSFLWKNPVKDNFKYLARDAMLQHLHQTKETT